MELAQRGAHLRVDQHALGDLERQLLRRQAVAAQRRGHALEHVDVLELDGGEVHVHADVAADRAAAGLVEHELADRHDQPGLLGQRDELAGRDEAALRVLPAHERLGGDHVAGGEAGDRLVLDRELACA